MARIPVPRPLGPVDYASAMPPPEYLCGQCGVLGVKLWREYQTFLNHQSLLCGACACREQSKEGKTFTVDARPDGGASAGYREDKHALRGDQIGWRIPAVPTADGRTYWGYTSVPSEGVAWWFRLPLTRTARP